MTTPPPYSRATSFTDWSTNTPEEPHRGQDLDQEFEAIEDAINGTQESLAQIQREDGALANDSVHPDALSDETLEFLEGELDTIGPEGPPSPQLPGPPGPAGPSGWPLTWIVGTSIPSVEFGVEGQLYLNDSNGDVYQRSDVSWVLVSNIRGPQGVPGAGGGVSDHGLLTGLSDADHPISAVSGLQTELNSLSAAISAAVTGQVRTYVQATSPTGALNAGDLWFNSGLGFRMYRWNGAAWVDVGDARIAQASVDAATAINAAAGAQATADGKVTSFYQTSAPVAEGIGDLWIDTDGGNKLYRWDGDEWYEVRDTGIAQALSNAATAQSTADGKIVTFYQVSAPVGAHVGDLWFDTDDDNHLYRHNGATWISARDAQIAQAAADAADAVSAAATAQATADGKIEVYYAANEPIANGVGDLWIDTDDNQLYRWTGSTWSSVQDQSISQALTDAALAQSTADGKIVTFYATSAPTADGIGDIWFDTDDENRPYRWDGGSWVDITPIADVTAGQIGALGMRAGAVSQMGMQTQVGTASVKFDSSSKVEIIDGTINPVIAGLDVDGSSQQPVFLMVSGQYYASWNDGATDNSVQEGPPIDFEIQWYNVTDGGAGSSTMNIPAMRTTNCVQANPAHHTQVDAYHNFAFSRVFSMGIYHSGNKTYRFRLFAFTPQPVGEVGTLELRNVNLSFIRFKR